MLKSTQSVVYFLAEMRCIFDGWKYYSFDVKMHRKLMIDIIVLKEPLNFKGVIALFFH